MWPRQLRGAIYFPQSTPSHRLRTHLSTVVVNCRWIGHRWNTLISSLRRLAAEGWLDVRKSKAASQTWGEMSHPSASSAPPLLTSPHQSTSICILVSNYQTAKGGGGGVIAVLAVCPWASCTLREGVGDAQATALVAKVCSVKIYSGLGSGASSTALMRGEVEASTWQTLPQFASFLFSVFLFAACGPSGPISQSHRSDAV